MVGSHRHVGPQLCQPWTSCSLGLTRMSLRPLLSQLSLQATALPADQTHFSQLLTKARPQKGSAANLSVNAGSIFNDHSQGVRFVVTKSGFSRQRSHKGSLVRRYLETGMPPIFSLAKLGQGSTRRQAMGPLQKHSGPLTPFHGGPCPQGC